MDIAEAIHQWETIRAFKSDLVPREILKEIMDLASCVLLWLVAENIMLLATLIGMTLWLSFAPEETY
jgi:hypothetical protein